LLHLIITIIIIIITTTTTTTTTTIISTNRHTAVKPSHCNNSVKSYIYINRTN